MIKMPPSHKEKATPIPQPSPKSFKTRYGIFSNNTSFHGFSELYESRTWWQRSAWILIILLFISMFFLFVSVQTNQYLDGRKATRVSRLANEAADGKLDLPPIFLVVTYFSWIDVAKVQRLGLKREELIMAMSYASSGLNGSNVPVQVAKERLKERMKILNISNILQLYPLIAMDSLPGKSSPNILLDGSYVGTNFAYHYLLNTTNVTKAEFADSWIFRFDFDYGAYWKKVPELYAFWEERNASDDEIKTTKLSLFNYDTYMSARMKRGYRIDINTESQIYRELGPCTNNHPIDRVYNIKICQLECKLRANATVNATSCFRYDRRRNAEVEMTQSYKGGNLSLCPHGVTNLSSGEIEGRESPIFYPMSAEKIKQREALWQKCNEYCLPVCDRWMTTWSVSTYKDEDNIVDDTTQVKIVFPDSKTILVIEEIQQYQWYDLVSDIGGLMGLWLGASMMSLVQLIHLCLCSRVDNAGQ